MQKQLSNGVSPPMPDRVTQTIDNLRPQIRVLAAQARSDLLRAIQEEFNAALTGEEKQPPAAPASLEEAVNATGQQYVDHLLDAAPAAKVCLVAHCTKPARAKGLCSAHYQTARRKKVARKKAKK